LAGYGGQVLPASFLLHSGSPAGALAEAGAGDGTRTRDQ
jgi:hypothetical protein